jgi:membrane-associated protease RseP (regulator of RpoE activity)
MKQLKTYFLHGGLFIITFITTTLAGAEWTNGKSILSYTEEGISFNQAYTWFDFSGGLAYSLCFLLILTAHEFGHYFAALYYRVKTTLPYYIPLPPLPLMLGTVGALIRIKSPIRSSQQNFDIGIAGPLAGFVVSIFFLVYAFTHLPPPEYIFQFHPEYEKFGLDYAAFVYTSEFMPQGSVDVIIGKNLLFLFFENFVADPARMPNAHEIIHYPFLFAGFLSLVFTSINLLPIGQLDGGHVLYGLVGAKLHQTIASIIFIVFIFYASIGYVTPFEPLDKLIIEVPLFIGFLFLALKGLGFNNRGTLLVALGIFTSQYLIVTFFPHFRGYSGWLLFAFIIGRFIGIKHSPCEIEQPLTRERVVLGWLALLIFVLCFAPDPIQLIEHVKVAP